MYVCMYVVRGPHGLECDVCMYVCSEGSTWLGV